nr:reverse transcriptase domain-containing protein [Tanacetum cinerariifolium]
MVTEYKLADLFTKALGRDRIEFLINKLGMRSFMSETLKQLMDEVDETMDTIIDQDMLHICPRVPGQSFAEPPFEVEILAFIQFPGHSAAIRMLTDGLYHKRNVDYAYLLWEDFVYHVEHKYSKKSNEMYYPRFTKVIIHHFMSKDSSIPRKNKVNWHYVREDHMFSTNKLVSRHQSTQQFGALLPIKLTNEEIRNSNAYKEYYAVGTGATPPKPKASIRKTRSSSDTTVTPPTTAAGPRLTTSTKGKQAAKATKAKSLSALSEVAMTEAQLFKLATKRSMQQTHISQASGSGADEGTGSIPGVPDVPTDEPEEELSWNSTDDEGDDDEGKDGDGDEEDDANDGEEGDGGDDDEDNKGEEGDDEDDDDDDQEFERDDNKDDEKECGDDEQEYDEEEYDKETRDEESFDPILKTPENSEDKGNGEEDIGLNVGGEERRIEEEKEDKLYKDVNINQGRGIQETLEVEDSHVTLTLVNPNGMESIFETTSHIDVQTPTLVTLLPMSALTITPSTIATITTTSQAQSLPTTAPSTIIQNLPNFGSLFGFDNRLRSLEANFSEFMQTNQFTGASDRLRDEAQRENDEFLKTVVENMEKIIKEHVKEQVKVQVSKILPRIEQTVSEQLKAEVLTRSSHSSKTSYVVAVDLSEMELKKILIEKIEGNKSIQRSNEQRNLYKALVEAYESDKIILDTYGETVTLKRRRDDDADKDEEPFAGPDRGSKRRREGKEPESTSTPKEKATRSAGKSSQGSKSRQASTSESNLAEDPMQTTFQREDPSHPEFDTELEYHLEEVLKATTDQLDWVNLEGQQYPHNLLKPLPLIPNNRGRRVIPFEHFINNDQEYLRGGASSRKYTTFIMKTKVADYGHIKWIEDLVPRTMWIEEPIGYDKHALWGVSHWGEDDDKLYKFKEGDFKRLRIQDIEDMLLLLVQGKLTNLTVKERFAFNVSLRMFTRSIVIQRRVEDLQLCVESYQKKLNLTKPDSYRSDLKRKEAYTAYSNPRGFIYQKKDKKNRSILTDLQVTPTKPGRMTNPYSSHRFIINCFNVGNIKMEVKVEAKALPTKDARVVVKFLKSLFTRFGTPRAIISDRGTHFCNDQFARVMTKYGVTHRLATAYHPQTSEQVEVSNRGLKRILEMTIGKNHASRSDKLDGALWAFRTAFKTPIGCTPYKLVYGKSCHLPIKLEHKAYWALKHANFDLKTAGDHQKLQLNELRDQAYENSLIYKERTKKLHDSKIKNHIFNVSDQVLLFNSRLKIFSGKLKTRWSGPFTITQVFHIEPLSYLNPMVQTLRITPQCLKTLVFGVLSRFARASHPLLAISFGKSDILDHYRLTFIWFLYA